MRLLDLYCGEGLAAWGYWRSGRFLEIVGVDLDPDVGSRYAFDFVQGDALRLDYEFLLSFDFIHASPPCQAYSKATGKAARAKHLRLVAATHLMLTAAGKPYVIENVEGSSRELRPNLVANGHWFGLPSERRRYFHVTGLQPHKLLGKGHTVQLHGTNPRRSTIIEAMGLETIPAPQRNRLTREGMLQGVPPAFTHWIAERMIPHKACLG